MSRLDVSQRPAVSSTLLNCIERLKDLLDSLLGREKGRTSLRLCNRAPSTPFEHLLAESIRHFGTDGDAPRDVVTQHLTDAWFDHIFESRYLYMDEGAWAFLRVARLEVLRELSKLEGDFVITVATGD